MSYTAPTLDGNRVTIVAEDLDGDIYTLTDADGYKYPVNILSIADAREGRVRLVRQYDEEPTLMVAEIVSEEVEDDTRQPRRRRAGRGDVHRRRAGRRERLGAGRRAGRRPPHRHPGRRQLQERPRRR